MVNVKKRSKEYFSEAEYGVKASPRVTTKKSNLARGGGRDQLGKPYKVRGKIYYPKEDKNYKKTGLASWYGDAFHGRLTANGEIYDMTHLTAAHPTMPLPSYARVTNVENGSSVIVRVNDRGPYSHNRLIDLSKRAAEMLDYTRTGTAKVKVEYVGRAPLDGEDDQYLMASYRPGNRAPDPSDGLAERRDDRDERADADSGCRTSRLPGRNARFDRDRHRAPLRCQLSARSRPERPALGGFGDGPGRHGLAILCGRRAARARLPPSPRSTGLIADAVLQSWKRMNGGMTAPPASGPTSRRALSRARARRKCWLQTLAAFGRTEIEQTEIDGTVWYGVNLHQ